MESLHNMPAPIFRNFQASLLLRVMPGWQTKRPWSVIARVIAPVITFYVIHTSQSARAASIADSTNSKPLAFVLRPTRVFKIANRGRENNESWIFSLIIQTDASVKLAPIAMTLHLLRNMQELSATSYSTEGLKALAFQSRLPPKMADGTAPPAPIYWPVAFRITQTVPAGMGVDAMEIELDARDQGGAARHGQVLVPIETYRQKVSLIFPFRGKGIILQGGAADGGHRNRSGQFALDASGLDDSWSIVAPGEGKQNSDYRGWGRQIIAPADGIVVRLRTDRPDQPEGDVNDPGYYAPEYKDGGDPGNFLVIDHGSSEFSMLAHFQAGSLLVKAGEHVHQGQPLGKLGHSGDTSDPHCHYQLQAGPDWESADGLPCKFSNVKSPSLDRGTYFNAK
jgi:murein DD-endopeptidase MepM/ murein hydrolase activator NlpD